jgi:glycosyltransferase involved in cell wall biosynthesis
VKILVYPHAAEIGGSQINAVDLAGAVRDLGHEVVVTSEAGPLVDRVRALGLEHLELPTRRRRPSPAVAAQIDRWVVERGIDVVHGYEWPPVFDALLTRQRRGTATIGTVMSMSVVPFLPRTVPLFVGTAQIAEQATAAGHRRVLLLEPPVDTATDHPAVDPGDFRRTHGLDSDTVLVGMVCRLVPDLKLEGLLAACDAVGQLAAEGRPVQLVIAGDGRSRDEIQVRAEAANAAAGRRVVVLTGQLADPAPAYAASDVLIGQGGSALRGMAFGKPIVVVGEQGFSELLTPDVEALFLHQGWFGIGPGTRGGGVPALREALRFLVDDRGERVDLGAYARKLVVGRFGMDRAAKLLEAEYHRHDDARGVGAYVDLARSGAMLVGYKIGRRLQRLRGTMAIDDANARPVGRR